MGLPGGSVVNNLSAMQEMHEMLSSIPGLGRSPREQNGNPLQYSCLGNVMVRGACWATFYDVLKSQTRLSAHTQQQKFRQLGE